MIKSFYQSLYNKTFIIDDQVNKFLQDKQLNYGDYEIKTQLHDGDMVVIVNY